MSSTAEALPQDRQGLFAKLAHLQRAFWMLNLMEMFERLAYYGVRVVIPIYIAQADEIHGLHFTQIQKGHIFFMWALVQTGVPDLLGRLRRSLRLQEDHRRLDRHQDDRLPAHGDPAGLLAVHVRLPRAGVRHRHLQAGHPGLAVAHAEEGELVHRLGHVLHARERRRLPRTAARALPVRLLVAGGVLRLRRDRVAELPDAVHLSRHRRGRQRRWAARGKVVGITFREPAPAAAVRVHPDHVRLLADVHAAVRHAAELHRGLDRLARRS